MSDKKPLPLVTDLNRDYFEGCGDGELRIRRCGECGRAFRFAHARCPDCWSPVDGWEVSGGEGTVSHYSVVHQPPHPAFAAPYVLAMVELREGVRMMTNIVGCDPLQVHIGMEVELRFEDRGEASLPVFTPREP